MEHLKAGLEHHIAYDERGVKFQFPINVCCNMLTPFVPLGLNRTSSNTIAQKWGNMWHEWNLKKTNIFERAIETTCFWTPQKISWPMKIFTRSVASHNTRQLTVFNSQTQAVVVTDFIKSGIMFLFVLIIYADQTHCYGTYWFEYYVLQYFKFWLSDVIQCNIAQTFCSSRWIYSE